MRKKIISLLLTACMLTMAACGSSDKATGSKETANAVYTNEYVSLAPYTGLKAEKKNYLVTDTTVQEEIQSQLSDYADYESVDRPAQEGDWVYANYTITVNGSVLDESQDGSYYFILGEEEYGPQLDTQLLGKSAGDSLSFQASYDADYENSDLAGKTADFEVTITDIQVEILPELTTDFIKEVWGYDNEADLEAGIHAQLEEQYAQESSDELKEDLLKQVIDTSTILKYSQAQYEEAYAYIESDYQGYATMFGMSLDDIYESFGMSKEDLEQEAMDQLSRDLVVQAIIENEEISLDDQEYTDGIAYYAEQNGYDSLEDFQTDYSEDEIRKRLLEDKVLKLLVEKAEITEVEAEHEF